MIETKKLSVNLVSDGTFLEEGGAIHGSMPKFEWELLAKPDRKNRVRLGMNILLIKAPSGNILVNAGMGTRFAAENKLMYGHSASKLNANLKKHNVTSSDITEVFCTSLHYHCAGGLSYLTKSGELFLTFPKARHTFQEASWKDVQNPSERQIKLYGPNPSLFRKDLQSIEGHGKLNLVNGDFEMTPGVKVEVVGGYGEGDSIVKIDTGSERYMYMGGVVPTPTHIIPPVITAFDRDPELTYHNKRRLLAEARDDGYIIIFPQGYPIAAAYLYQDGLRKVDLD